MHRQGYGLLMRILATMQWYSSNIHYRQEWEKRAEEDAAMRGFFGTPPFPQRSFGGYVEYENITPHSQGLVRALKLERLQDIDYLRITQDLQRRQAADYRDDVERGVCLEYTDMKLVNDYYALLKEQFDNHTSKPGLNPRDFDFTYQSITEIIDKHKRRKKNKIVSLTAIEHEDVPNYILHMTFDKGKAIKHDCVGMYRVDFDEGDVVFYIKWEIGAGRARLIDCCSMGTEGGFRKLSEAHRIREEKQRKPKKGMWTASINPQGVVRYNKKKSNAEPLVHEAMDGVLDQIETHFNNLERRKHHTYTLLLYGVKGTGKSQILEQVGKTYAKSHCIVFTDNLSCMFQHEALAAKYKVPTLVFLEEAEEAIAKYNPGQGFDRVNTSVKNMMSGFYAEKNPAGTFKIYTTNHPNRITKDILGRKERVDELIHVGELNEIDAGRVAALNLGESMPKGGVGRLFNGMTGCDIKHICLKTIEQSEARGNLNDDGNAVVTIKMLKDRITANNEGIHHAMTFDQDSSEEPL